MLWPLLPCCDLSSPVVTSPPLLWPLLPCCDLSSPVVTSPPLLWPLLPCCDLSSPIMTSPLPSPPPPSLVPANYVQIIPPSNGHRPSQPTPPPQAFVNDEENLLNDWDYCTRPCTVIAMQCDTKDCMKACNEMLWWQISKLCRQGSDKSLHLYSVLLLVPGHPDYLAIADHTCKKKWTL